MKKHELINMLLDKEAEEQCYSIEQRDAFIAGCERLIEYEREKCHLSNMPFINGIKNEGWAIKQIEMFDPRRFHGDKNSWRGGIYYGHEVLDIVKRVMNRFIHIFQVQEETIEALRRSTAVATANAITKDEKAIYVKRETIKDLEGIRDYFGKHDRTPFEHMAFDVIDRIIKDNSK